MTRNTRREQRIEQIKKAIEDGAETRRKIAKKIGLSYEQVANIILEEGIEVIVDRPISRAREICDNMIREGRLLKEIGEELNVSKEAVRKYVQKTEQYDIWSKAKEENRKNEKRAKQELVDVLLARAYRLASGQGFAYQKAFEHYLRNRIAFAYITEKRFERLVRLFSVYKKAEEEGNKLSLEELAEKTGFCSYPNVGGVLKIARLKPMHGTKERRVITREKKEKLKRAFYVDINCGDLSYFLGMHPNVIWQSFKRIGERERKPDCIKIFSFSERLNYRIASRIYEADDAGFSPREICEYAECSDRVRQYAIENKEDIKAKIVGALKTIFPDKEIKKPYL